MKTKLHFLTFLLVSSALFFACNTQGTDNTEGDADSTQNATTEEIAPAAVDEVEVQTYKNDLRGGAFIKPITVQGTEAIVLYPENYDDYKATYPVSQFTPEDYEKAFEKNAMYEKALVEVPVKLMRKFEGLDKVTVQLTHKGTTYKTTVSRSQVEEYTGMTFQQFFDDWKTFQDPYVFDDEGRAAYIEKFVITE